MARSTKTARPSLNCQVAREVMGWKIRPLRVLEGYQEKKSAKADDADPWVPIYRTVPVRNQPPEWDFMYHGGGQAYVHEAIPDFSGAWGEQQFTVIRRLQELGFVVGINFGSENLPEEERVRVIVAEPDWPKTKPAGVSRGFFPKALCEAALVAVRVRKRRAVAARKRNRDATRDKVTR